MSGLLAEKLTDTGNEPQWIRPVHTIRVWIPCNPSQEEKSEG